MHVIVHQYKFNAYPQCTLFPKTFANRPSSPVVFRALCLSTLLIQRLDDQTLTAFLFHEPITFCLESGIFR